MASPLACCLLAGNERSTPFIGAGKGGALRPLSLKFRWQRCRVRVTETALENAGVIHTMALDRGNVELVRSITRLRDRGGHLGREAGRHVAMGCTWAALHGSIL